MKVQDLLIEARQPGWAYTEKRVKGALDKVTLALSGNDSGAMTRLTKRYERLDKSAKLLKEKRDELNFSIKEIGDRVFDAEDSLATRIIETISYTVMLTAGEKAETKKATAKVDYEAAYFELAKLIPELTEQADAIRAKYTEMIPPKDTPTALKVKAKVQEGVLTTVKVMWSKFMDSIKQWGRSYDSKLNAIKAKYPVKGKKITEAKLKSIKITVPTGFTEAKADDFIENQEVVTVEYFDLKGTTLYVYPMLDLLGKYDTLADLQVKLQKAFDRKKITEAKIKAYKLDIPRGFTEAQADEFIENQEVVTVEYFELKGGKMYVYPHFEMSDEKIQGKLQDALDTWHAWNF